jgi:hypothetical protein
MLVADVARRLGLSPDSVSKLDGLLCPKIETLPSGRYRRVYDPARVETLAKGRESIRAQREELRKELARGSR